MGENSGRCNITFWGVRGSIPTPMDSGGFQKKLSGIVAHLQQQRIDWGVDGKGLADRIMERLPSLLKTAVGGNTSCVSAFSGADVIIFDAGTGIRLLGENLMKAESFRNGKGVCHLFLSHLHWDHLQGLPFFSPLYVAGNEIHVYGVHPKYEESIRCQQRPPFFPVPIDVLKSRIVFHTLREDEEVKFDRLKIRSHKMSHPGGCYAYRGDCGEKSFIYATDSDFLFYDADNYKAMANFFSLADLIIFDAQFTLTDAFKKYDYGHSHAKKGVDLAVREGIRRLFLFHHDPTYDDEQIAQVLEDARAYLKSAFPQAKLEISIGMEGLSVYL